MSSLEVTQPLSLGTTVLVTGATGTLGPELVKQLLKIGTNVRILLEPGTEKNSIPNNVEIIVGDINDRNAVKGAVRGITIIYHLAGKLHTYEHGLDIQQEFQQVNVLGTQNLLNAAQEAGVKRFVFFSTINIYGVSNYGQILDERSSPNPETHYAKTKLEAEEAVLLTKSNSNQPLGVVLRLAAVYGPSMKGNYLKMLKGLQQGWFIPIGPSQNRRTLIYLDDVVQAALLVGDHPGAAGNVYNLTDGHVYSLLNIIDSMCSSLGRRTPKIHLPVRIVKLIVGLLEDLFKLVNRKVPYGRRMLDAMIEDRAVSGEKIQQEIGFQPTTDLNTGWRKVVEELSMNN